MKVLKHICKHIVLIIMLGILLIGLHQVIFWGKFFEVYQFIRDLHHEDIMIFLLFMIIGIYIERYCNGKNNCSDNRLHGD